MSEIRVDTISEKTSANGVAVDGVTIKDGNVGAAGTATSIAGIPFYSADNSIYTHDVSGTDNSASFNTAYGIGALDAITTGDKNVAIGYNAGTALTEGTGYNVFVGYTAGASNTTGDFNTVLGAAALNAATTSDNNIAIGPNAIQYSDTEAHNLAIGRDALNQVNSGGEYNVAIGNYSLDALTSGDNNTAVGYNAGTALTTGSENSFFGYQAGLAHTTGTRVTAIGRNAYYRGDGENDNIAMGYVALGGNLSGGEFNVAIGNYSMENLTSGDENVAVGYHAGKAITTGSENVFVGQEAGLSHTTGANNIAMGKQALKVTTTGSNNVCIGGGAGQLGNMVNGNNILIGQVAGQDMANGAFNVAIGVESMQQMQGDRYNVAIGYKALNVANTGTSINDVGNVAVGGQAGLRVTTGAGSTFVGNLAGDDVTTGSSNVFIGQGSGDGHQTGSGNVCVGNDARPSASGSTHQKVFGQNVQGSGNSTFTFGNSATDTTCTDGATSFSAPSDIRIKKDIETSEVGLSFINDLRPVNFKFKTKGELDSDFYLYEEDSTEIVGHTDKDVNGFIAQEIKSVIDNHPEYKGNELWKEGNEEQSNKQRVSQTALIPILTKAIQELSAKVKALEEA